MKLATLPLVDHITNLVDPTLHTCVAIVGLPSSGKSTTCMQIENKYPGRYRVFHTDELISYNNASKQQIAMNIIATLPRPWIVEGTLVYELLLNRLIHPTLIISCVATRKVRYDRRGKETLQYDKTLGSLWESYQLDHRKEYVNTIYITTHVAKDNA